MKDSDLKKILQEQQKETEQYIEEVVVQERKQTERYIGALKEDFDHKVDAVMEYVKDIPPMKEKQEMMFDTMGQMAEDITVIKEVVKDHSTEIQRLKTAHR